MDIKQDGSDMETLLDRAHNFGWCNGGNQSDGYWDGDRIARYFRAEHLTSQQREALEAAYRAGAGLAIRTGADLPYHGRRGQDRGVLA